MSIVPMRREKERLPAGAQVRKPAEKIRRTASEESQSQHKTGSEFIRLPVSFASVFGWRQTHFAFFA